MNELLAPAASTPDPYGERVRALDAVLAAAQGHGVLARAELRDTSNRSARDWPWWSVEISRTYTNGPQHYHLAATVRQACTAELGIGELAGSWRTEGWLDVGTNHLNLAGRQLLVFGDLATPDAFLAVVEALFAHARMALERAGRSLP